MYSVILQKVNILLLKDTFNNRYYPEISQNSRGARVSSWLWILKVKGPSQNLHNLISVCDNCTGRNFWNQDHLSIQNILDAFF